MALFGEYTILKTINPDGGEAIIYKVRHNEWGDIKALRVPKTSINSEEDDAFLKFKDECKKLLRLSNHPNIVKIYRPRFWKEPGEEEGKAYVEMEFVDGKDLLKHLTEDEQNFIPIEDVLRMAEQISSALAFCHVDVYTECMTGEERNEIEKAENEEKRKTIIDRLIKDYRVVHNDIHSNNIIRRKNGDYVLLDFGLAFDGKEVVRSTKMKGGVIAFMAPEKFEALREGRKLEEKELTPQLDIYGFGVVLYEYLAGKLPNKDCTDKNSIEQSIYNSRKQYFEKKYPEKEYTKDYPDWLVDVIIICLRKYPEKHFENGKGLHDYIVDHLKETKEGGVIISHDSDKDKDTDTGEGKGKGNNKKWLGIIILLLLGCIGIYYRFIRENEPAKVIIKVESVNDSLGTVRGAGTYSRGDTITIEAIAKEGCKFVVWNDENTDSIRKVVADQDIVYTARFVSIVTTTPIVGSDTIDKISDTNDDSEVPEVSDVPVMPVIPKFTITVKTDDPNMGTVTGGGSYDSLAPVTIEAIANNGYRFVSWDDGNTQKKRTFKVTANQKYVARFVEKLTETPPSVTSVIEVDWNGVATYTGPGLGSQPDGFGGKLVFYKDYQLDLKKIDGRKLDIKAGEIIEPTKFKDGKLNIIGVGTLHRKDGTTHPIM